MTIFIFHWQMLFMPIEIHLTFYCIIVLVSHIIILNYLFIFAS
jgi:hypothetical protein